MPFPLDRHQDRQGRKKEKRLALLPEQSGALSLNTNHGAAPTRVDTAPTRWRDGLTPGFTATQQTQDLPSGEAIVSSRLEPGV